MNEEYTDEDWKAFEKRVLDDPQKRAEWANMVIDAWIKRNSGKLGKHSTRSKKSS